jgi:AraC-like DNA-binding protein/GGDEF domain-containing protein
VAQIEQVAAPFAQAHVPDGGSASYAVAALLDIDDFVVARLARGTEWAAAEVATIESLTEAEQAREPRVSSLYRLEPDEWIFILTGPEPAVLEASARELADRLRLQVEERTACTATVSLGGVAAGPDQVEQTLSEAVQANQRKLVLGGNRVIAATQIPATPALPSPERIENELSQKLQVGDQEGALRVLKTWVTKSAELEGVTPEVLRSWLAAEILFALNVVGQRRLSDGSMDWLEIFGKTSFDELLAMGTIHEQSYLGLWLERLFERLFEQPGAPRTSGRHILKLVETYIRDHYAEDLSLTKVAQAVFVSPFYISHLFHRELDTTFLRYLTAIRIARARQMLLDTDLQVSEIGALVGYGTAKNFRCAFKRVVGSTPTAFRAQS